MSYGYSVDLRERVLSYIKEGYSQKEASKVFKITRQTIYNWVCLKEETGGVEMRRLGKRRCSKLDEAKLKEMIALNPDYYLSEIAEAFKATSSGVCRALKRWGLTRKKRVFSSRNKMKVNVKNFWPS